MGKGKHNKTRTRGRSDNKTQTGKKKEKKPSQQSHGKKKSRNKNGVLTFSALYIIVAFAFGILSFLLGRGPLTSNFPILEKFYSILPKQVTQFSNNVLYSLGLDEMISKQQTQNKSYFDNNDQIEQNSNSTNNNNNNIIIDSNVQPLTKNRISMDSKTMSTSYFSSSDELNSHNKCDIENWLMKNDISFDGYHVLCVLPSNDQSNGRLIKYHRNGLFNIKTSKQFIFDQFINDDSIDNDDNSEDSDKEKKRQKAFESLRKSLEKVLSIKRTDTQRSQIINKKDRWLKWEMYDIYGRSIDSSNMNKLFYGIILIYEVGLFVYPPIEEGFSRLIKVRNMNPDSILSYGEYISMKLTTLSISPVVLEISGFIANEYCDYIINDSDKHMRKSTVSHMHNTEGNANQWRTSSTHWLKQDDSIVHIIDCQTSSLTHLPLTHQENVQVLRYFEGEQYDSHWDYFDPSLYKGTNMQEKIRGGRNRFLTLFWYMSNVTNGGWTYFPMAFNNQRPKSFKLKKINDCNKGLKVTPKKGNAIIFYSMKPDGNVDPKSLHGACPVGHNQTKWGANKWIWTRPVHGYV